jgi:hypothetical protein
VTARLLLSVGLLLACSAAEPLCDPYDGGPNPSSCPATHSAAQQLCSGSRPCTPGVDPPCAYVGAGEEMGGCWGNAAFFCQTIDAGVGVWSCVQ